MTITLITGGARSGKSTLAQEIAQKNGRQVLFVATAEAGDLEMQRRIEAHKKSRPAGWKTLEIQTRIGSRILEQAASARTVVIDCITLLISNVIGKFDEKSEPAEVDKAITSEIKELINCMNKCKADFIIVTNEVGLGIIPGDYISRLYRDLLGKANRLLAERADNVYFMVAGIPMAVKGKKTNP
jgi:adenosylcobinamide kinase / adenosylcobinamide-phosphate guanylyltransferase